MKAKLLTYFFLLGPMGLLQAQDWLIRGSIEDAAVGPVLLASYYGDRFIPLDTAMSSSGSFYFVLPGDTPPGMFRIIYAEDRDGVRTQDRFVEFIFNQENIELVVSSSGQGPVPFFENSLENVVYREFVEFELGYEAAIMEVYGQLYPSREVRAEEAVAHYNRLQRTREHFMDSISALHPDLYAVRLMNAFRAPFIPGEISHGQRIDTLKECFFDRAPINDPSLLHAPVYTYKLIEYLSLYREAGLSREEQEEKFLEAVDRIMVNVSGEGTLRDFVVDYLLEGFEMLDMEEVQLHLAENYLDENCESEVAELVRSRMEGYRKMRPGARAPDLVLRDIRGMTYQLSELESSYVLVLFWSSGCQHCLDLLPQLRDWYLKENHFDLEVLAVSIDSSQQSFEQVHLSLELPWISARDPLGWQGKAPSDYHVYATPSMFLLDRERNILARPSGMRQLIRTLKKL